MTQILIYILLTLFTLVFLSFRRLQLLITRAATYSVFTGLQNQRNHLHTYDLIYQV